MKAERQQAFSAAQITPEQLEHRLLVAVLLQELVEQLVVDTRVVALYIRTENKLVSAKAAVDF